MPEEPFTLAELATCAEREVKQRERVYARLGMTTFRRREIAMMREIARILRYRTSETIPPDLFRQPQENQP